MIVVPPVLRPARSNASRIFPLVASITAANSMYVARLASHSRSIASKNATYSDSNAPSTSIISRNATPVGVVGTLGILYYPGGDLDAWTDDTHPCLYQARANLTSAGAVSAVYRPVLDRMSFLRSSPDEETALMSGNANQVMTIVAYAGNGTDVVRSPPRRVRVASASAVAGDTSVVGRVNTLTLIARFDAGSLRYLQWHDLGCGECAAEDACFDVGDGHTACAGTETNCGCDAAVAAASGSSCLFDLSPGSADLLRCQLTVATAFSGTDARLAPLESAAQIERLGRYSVTGALRGTGAGALAAAVTG